MTHRVRIVPVRQREYDADLGCDISRVIGYRAVCSCGWRSPYRRTVTLARVEGVTHRQVAVG